MYFCLFGMFCLVQRWDPSLSKGLQPMEAKMSGLKWCGRHRVQVLSWTCKMLGKTSRRCICWWLEIFRLPDTSSWESKTLKHLLESCIRWELSKLSPPETQYILLQMVWQSPGDAQELPPSHKAVLNGIGVHCSQQHPGHSTLLPVPPALPKNSVGDAKMHTPSQHILQYQIKS